MITSNTRKKFEDFEYFQVPFTKNIHDYINEIHRETNHRGINSLRNELIKKTNLRKREKAKLSTFNFIELESDTLVI